MVESCPDICCCLANIVPVATFGNDKAVYFREKRGISLTVNFLRLGRLFVPNVRDALEEQKWEDVTLPVRSIYGRSP